MDYTVWEEDYKVWIYDNRPLEQLDWDPMEYHWNIPNQKNKQFFAYTTCIGGCLLLQKLAAKTPTKNRWASHKVPGFFLHRFWDK